MKLREDLWWLLETINQCSQRWIGRTTKKDIFRGSYDVWFSPDDPKRYDEMMNHRLLEAKEMGLIVNESVSDIVLWKDNWYLTDLGRQELELNRNQAGEPPTL